jgi:hypothetical protein
MTGGYYERHFSVLSELTDDIAEDTREAILAMDTLIVLATPVDTGRAQANWTVSVGSADESQVDWKGAPEAAAQFAINQAQVAVKGIKGFGVSYLQNNLPYIVPLNNGHSGQAGTRYIDIIVEQVANAR